MTQEAAIGQCRTLIGLSLGWGDPASWTNEDFDTLSESIFEKTGVRLSVSTLKRVWGKVKYDSSPTMATLNTLARYAGFEGWRDFINKLEPPAPAPIASALAPAASAPASAVSAPAPSPLATVGQKRPAATTPIILFTIAALALLSLLSARLIRTSQSMPTGPLRFEARRVTDRLPNSVVFDYDASSFHPRNVIIQQSWDPKRRETVPVDGKQHTSVYYAPGFFRAKLIVDGEIKKQTDVFIPSNGWQGAIDQPLPLYLSPTDIRQDSGSLGITRIILKEKLRTDIFSNQWTWFANVRELPGITGDQVTFETVLRNTSTVEECLCRRVEIILLGKLSAIIIPLADKGCISDIGLYTGSDNISGKDNDLSAFGCEFPQWQRLKCTISDHRIEIRLNGRTIFTRDNISSIGDIVGARISFEGAGDIKEFSLDGGGKKIDLMLP